MIVQHKGPAIGTWQTRKRRPDRFRLFSLWVDVLGVRVQPGGGNGSRGVQVIPGEALPPAQGVDGQVGGDAIEPRNGILPAWGSGRSPSRPVPGQLC